MRIAITGFGPFGQDTYNPTESLVGALTSEDRELVGRVFEVSRQAVDDELFPWLEETNPDAILSLGLAGGRTALAIEAIAVNRVDFGIPDVRGQQPKDGLIRPEGPTAYASGISVDKVTAIWTESGVPGYISYSAGTYLCNYLYYRTSDWCVKAGPGHRAAFIHVPYSTVYVPRPERHPSMEESRMQKGIRVLVDALRVGKL